MRAVLLQAYPSGANVDDALIEILLAPTRDPGALESFRGFVNLFNDHLAPDLLAGLTSSALLPTVRADNAPAAPLVPAHVFAPAPLICSPPE